MYNARLKQTYLDTEILFNEMLLFHRNYFTLFIKVISKIIIKICLVCYYLLSKKLLSKYVYLRDSLYAAKYFFLNQIDNVLGKLKGSFVNLKIISNNNNNELFFFFDIKRRLV